MNIFISDGLILVSNIFTTLRSDCSSNNTTSWRKKIVLVGDFYPKLAQTYVINQNWWLTLGTKNFRSTLRKPASTSGDEITWNPEKRMRHLLKKETSSLELFLWLKQIVRIAHSLSWKQSCQAWLLDLSFPSKSFNRDARPLHDNELHVF